MKQKLLDRIRQIEPGKALLVAMAVVFLVSVLSFINYYSLQNVTVLGNVHYTEEEIRAEVTKGIFGKNTWAVSRLKSSFTPEDMELIDQIDVVMKDHHTLQITVQERQLIGYVQYLDCNLYFDSEGRVMDSVIREEETDKTASDGEGEALTAEAVGKTATSFVAAMKEAPLITGLSFTHAQLHEILPVSDDAVFYTILGITRMINKYDINPDAVNFDESMQITLSYGDVTVDLGKDELMEEKLARVAAILPDIEGKSGVLHMEDYTSGTQNIVFSQSVLAAEGIDEEDEAASGDTVSDGDTATGDTTADTTASNASSAGTTTGTVDHSYALVTVKKQQTTSQNTDTSTTGNTTTETTGTIGQGSTTTETTQQGTADTTQQSGTTTGTTKQGTAGTTGQSGTTTGTTKQGTTGTTVQSDTTTGTAQSGSTGSTGTTGSGEIQIDKPVLGNLQ